MATRQQIAQQQANHKENLELTLRNSLLRWLLLIKKNASDFSPYQQQLINTLGASYANIIKQVTPQTLNQLNHELSANDLQVLEMQLNGDSSSQAIIRAALILATLQRWRQSMSYTDWLAKSRSHISSIIVNTEVQPIYENTKVQTALAVGSATAYRKAAFKQWLTIIDGKERPAHGEANLQKVQITQEFLVGGENLRYPGDPTGSLSNIANCRCSLIFLRKAG